MTIKLWQVTSLISKSFLGPNSGPLRLESSGLAGQLVRYKLAYNSIILTLEKSVFHNYQRLTGKRTLSPLFGSYGGGYPARMNMSYWTPPIPKENLSVNSHHRFNVDLEQKLFKDAKFFTSIREPLSMFRSRMVSKFSSELVERSKCRSDGSQSPT